MLCKGPSENVCSQYSRRIVKYPSATRRSVSTVRCWSVWQSINRRAASSPIVRVGGHEISFAGQNLRSMHSAKPFFSSPPLPPASPRSFYLSKIFHCPLARSQSLAFKTEIQHANCRPLYPNRIERGWPWTRRVSYSPTREIWFLYQNPKLFPALVRFSPVRPWTIPSWSWMKITEKLNFSRGRRRQVFPREILSISDRGTRACHEIIRTCIFPCIIRASLCDVANLMTFRSAFGLTLSRASVRLHNLILWLFDCASQIRVTYLHISRIPICVWNHIFIYSSIYFAT